MKSKKTISKFPEIEFPVCFLNFPGHLVKTFQVAGGRLNPLTSVLARKVVAKPGRLTGKELRFLRKGMRETLVTVGVLLGVSPSTVKYWEDHENIDLASEFVLRNVAAERLDLSLKFLRSFTRFSWVMRHPPTSRGQYVIDYHDVQELLPSA